MLYFRGCTAREREGSIVDSTEFLLDYLGIDYKELENEPCCGSILLRSGFREDAIELMRDNADLFQDETILTSCGGCYKTLKEDYKKEIGLNLNIIHISQLLNKHLDSKLKLEKRNDLNVTYHDSCHLGRHSGVFDEPRSIIKSIANLKEMKHNRENSLCCGSGGGVKSAYGDMSNKIAKNRVDEALDIHCNTIITVCPFCKKNLKDNSNLKIYDLSEFVKDNIKK